MSDDWDEVTALLFSDDEIEQEYQRHFEVGCIVECRFAASFAITPGKRYLVIDVMNNDIWIMNNNHVPVMYHKTYFIRVHFIP